MVSEAWTVILEPAEEGGWVAKVAEFPGAISEGETQDEAREMVLEALDELLELHRERALASKSNMAVVLAA